MEQDRHAKKAAAIKAKRGKQGRKAKAVRSKKFQEMLGKLDECIQKHDEQFALDMGRNEAQGDDEDDDDNDNVGGGEEDN